MRESRKRIKIAEDGYNEKIELIFMKMEVLFCLFHWEIGLWGE